MASARRLVEVPDDLWSRIKIRAATEGRELRLVVQNALRLYLTSVEPKFTEAEEQLRANVPRGNEEATKPNAKATIQALLDSGRIRRASDSPPALKPCGCPDDGTSCLHGIPASIGVDEPLTHRHEYLGQPREPEHDHGRPLSPREIERRRLARLEFLRAHPEDAPDE